MYATINNQSVPFDSLQLVTITKDVLTIGGETKNEVQWLKVDRILESLSIGDTVEFRVEVQENGDYVYKRGKGKIASIDKREGMNPSQITFSVKISIIRLISPKTSNV